MNQKQQTSIENLIDEAIPNSFGVSIDINLLKQLWNNEKEFKKFNDYIYNFMMGKITKFNIDNMLVYCSFLIQSLNEKKSIKLSEETIINMFLQYFNAPFHFSIEPIDSLESKQENLKEKTKKLKNLIRQKIKELEETKNIEDVKTIMPDLYENYKYLYEKFYFELKNYIKNKDDKFSFDFRWKEYFEKIKTTDISKFRNLNLWIENLIKELSIPIDFNLFKNINTSKLKLFIAKQYIEYINIIDKKNSILLMDFIRRTINEQKNLNTFIKDISFITPNKNNLYYEYYDNKMLEKEFNEYLEQNPKIKAKLDKLSEYNKEDFSNLNYNEILEYVDMILEDEEIKKELEEIDEQDITNELSTLNQEIDEENISEEDRNKLISQKHKLEFLFKECKPYKICKGINTFDGYYGYIYPNGILVLDYINKDPKKSYGNAIYIMPLEKLKDYSNLSKQEIRNKISKNELEDVKYIYHDSKGNWKEKIKSKISKVASKELKINFNEIELPFDLKELDKIEEKLSQSNNSILK